MDLEGIMLSEISQKEKAKIYALSHVESKKAEVKERVYNGHFQGLGCGRIQEMLVKWNQYPAIK